MNETLRTIKNRRAIRNYSIEQIPDYILETILNAALYAPSAMNKQSWHFAVVQNKDVLHKLASKTIENVIDFNNKNLIDLVSSPNYHPFYKAPTLIIISGDTASEFVKIETGAAAQNIALAAESLGIGSCIMTMSNFAFIGAKAEGLKAELGIPGGYHPICSVALGYKAGALPEVPPRNTDVIRYIK